MNSFVVLILVSFTDLSLQAGWSYDHQNEWPGVCTAGQQQSPIHIKSQEAVVDKYQAHIRGPLQFSGYENVKVVGINNGHALQWDATPGDNEPPVLSGGPLRGEYTFLQFHMHWMSEHAIDDLRYPLEIHLVHIKSGLTIDEAMQRADGLAVIGVLGLLSFGYESERALYEIMPGVSQLNHTNDRTDDFKIDVSRLLSRNPQSYYTYHGSLTTPMCEETVTWIVMDEPIYISDLQYQEFSNVDIGSRFNYRDLQPTNRVVYRSLASSCASLLGPSILGTFLSTLSCLSSIISAAISKGICAVSNVKRKYLGHAITTCAKSN